VFLSRVLPGRQKEEVFLFSRLPLLTVSRAAFQRNGANLPGGSNSPKPDRLLSGEYDGKSDIVFRPRTTDTVEDRQLAL
jgi:hypothetical protein